MRIQTESKMTTRNDRNQEFVLPHALKDRCMRTYEWSTEFTERALLGYRQFMKLKIQVEDFTAETLAPSSIVELVWRQHILDVGHYCKSCFEYSEERLIDYNPDNGFDQSAPHDQITATQVALKALFGRQVDAEIWSFDHASTSKGSQQSSNDVPDPATIGRRSVTQRSKNVDNRTITLWIRDPGGVATFFKLLRSTKLGKVFEAYARHAGVEMAQLKFILNDHFVTDPDLTPNDLNVEDQDSLLAVVIEEGSLY
jgi:hypothetical protein